jgi:hypothetical protein
MGDSNVVMRPEKHSRHRGDKYDLTMASADIDADMHVRILQGELGENLTPPRVSSPHGSQLRLDNRSNEDLSIMNIQLHEPA